MFTLRRIALAPRVCGVAPTPAVSMPLIACQRNRRYSSSSSKPSNPSDGARSPSSSSGTTTSGISAATTTTIKRNGRVGLKTIRTAMGMKEGTKIPVVPSTDHLHPADVAISTFFAQHRPVSISHVVPLSYSENSFDSIFARRKLSPIHDSAASSNAADFEALESAASGGLEPNMHSSSASGEQNANSPVRLPQHLLQLGKRFMPFCPPPVPVPQTAFVRPVKVFANKIDMPMERIMIRQQIREEPAAEERGEMIEPEGEHKGVMQALSVKRRRGLRMKKHKLKKLRKRTRNLRRRIESHSR